MTLPPKTRHLLHITHDLRIGGLQQVVATLCRNVDPTLFRTSVLCLREKGALAVALEAEGFPCHCLNQGTSADYFAFRDVARLIRRENVDVVHTHNTQPLLDGTLGAMLAGGRTVVHTDHSRTFPDKRRYMVAEWFLSHFLYRMVGVSSHTTANLRKFEHIPRRKLLTIPNGIDATPFQERPDRAGFRRELGIPEDALLLGMGSRLVEGKGITWLIRALAALHREFPRTELLLAGDGDHEETLREEAREAGLADAVHFVGPRTDMPRILGILDVYTFPSLSEGLPMAILEAMAAGCPVVATAVGGVPGLIQDGVNGILVPPADADALASAIGALLRDPLRRASLAAEGRATFEAGYTAERMARSYEALYLRQARRL